MKPRGAVRLVVATGMVAVLTAFALGGTFWLIGTFPIIFFLCATVLYWILSAMGRRRPGGRSPRNGDQP
ncbi:MAG: hypothetical protein M0Z66_11345 [Thermaerobacter sp.]|nr:hypothetical protein [Thermaerobacter sp.]